MPVAPKLDIHQRITNQIIAAIEAGSGDYQMPWNPRLCFGSTVSIPHNPIGRYGYRGLNILGLWSSQQESSYQTAEWATFRQWQSAGAQVRKGEKGALTVFYKSTDSAKHDNPEDATAQPSQRRIIARASYVFNSAQVDGYIPHASLLLSEVGRHGNADQVISASGANIHHGGPSACYIPSRDEIHLPPAGAFCSPIAYYNVAFHELSHWTGHATRCDRDLRNRFGSEAYAMEELIAELGAAFLCVELGLSQEPRLDHARYIESWLGVLRRDKRAIFTAAAKASQATMFLTDLVGDE